MLLASTASAQSPNANAQGKGHAADPAKTAAAPAAKAEDNAKGDEKKDKAADKAKGDDKSAKADDKAEGRAARKAKEHEAQKATLSALLKAPVDDALKQELRRHAERVARIERIKSVATDAKDTDAGERATKLLAKENARHDKWMEKHVGTPTTAPAAQPAMKEGAK
jgi:hypothetical protein